MEFGPIVSTEWLAGNIADPTVIALDASVEKTDAAGGTRVWHSGRQSFEDVGHIPGARFADLISAFSDAQAPFSFTRPRAAQFAAAAEALGISNRHRIVVYDNSNGIWAARLWWLFRSLGHDEVAVLDGGLAAWRNETRPIDRGLTPPVVPAGFATHARPGFFVDKAGVKAIAEGRAPGLLVCVLRAPVFAGAEQNYSRAGHIPGSINLPFGELLDACNRFLPAGILERRLAVLRQGGEPLVLYCGGGVTAAGTALALNLVGVDDVAIYDGSLSEWSADPALPMILSPEQSQMTS